MYFDKKFGPFIYLVELRKGTTQAAHPYFVIYIENTR